MKLEWNQTRAARMLAVAAAAVLGPALGTQGATDTWTNGNNDSAWYVGTMGSGFDWSVNGSPGAYNNGDAVIFDDSAMNSFAISVQGVVSPSSITFNNSTYAYTITGGSITGNGLLSMTGAGLVTLSAANTYSGGTALNGGVVNATTGALGTGPLTFNGGTLQFAAVFDPSFNGSAQGLITLNAGGGTFDTNGQNITFNGGIGGNGALTKTGAGMLTLNNSGSLFSGGVNINAGVLSVASAADLGSSSNTISFGGGTLQFTGGTSAVPSSHAITLNLDGGTIDTDGNSITIASVIAGGGGLTKTGAGTLMLTNANTYGGATTVNAGTLVGSNTALPGGGPLIVNAGTLDLHATGSPAFSFGLLSGNSSSGLITDTNSSAGTDALTFNQTTDGTYLGAISDGSPRHISVTKTGPGTLILAGSNNYTGGTTVTGGLLQFNTANSLPSTAPGAITVTAPGALAATGAFMDVNSTLPYINATSTGAVALVGSSTPGPISFAGHNMLSLGAVGLATYTGALMPGTNGYLLGGGGGVLTLPNSNQLTGSASLSVGSNGLPGAVALGGSNSYTGGTTVNGGTLVVSAVGATGTGDVSVMAGTLAGTGTVSGNVNLSSGATISPDGGTMTIGKILTLSAGSILNYTFASPGGPNDLLQVNGSLATPASNNVILNINAISQYGSSYPLINYSGGSTGAGNPGQWTVTFDGASLPPGATPTLSVVAGTPNVVSLSLTAPTKPASPPALDPRYIWFPPTREPNLPPGSPVMTCYNESFNNSTGVTQYQLNLVMAGDVGPGGFTLTGYPAFGPGSQTGISYHYDPSTNLTTISVYPNPGSPFYGRGIPPGYSGHIGYCVPGGPGGAIEGQSPLVLAKFCGGSKGVLPITVPPGNYLPVGRFADNITSIPANQPTVFCILYAEIESNEGGNWVTAGEWSEIQVPVGQPFLAKLFDDSNVNIPDFIFDAKFMFSTTEIPLDDLSSTYEDPDSSGLFSPMTIASPQVLIPGLFDGEMIPEGGNATAELIYQTATPEPSGAAVLALSSAGLLARRRRSVRQRAPADA